MTLEEIKNTVMLTLADIQTLSGEKPEAISEDTIPLKNLPGFDSYRAVEVTSELIFKWKLKIKGMPNLFSKNIDGHNKNLTVKQVSELIFKIIYIAKKHGK